MAHGSLISPANFDVSVTSIRQFTRERLGPVSDAATSALCTCAPRERVSPQPRPKVLAHRRLLRLPEGARHLLVHVRHVRLTRWPSASAARRQQRGVRCVTLAHVLQVCLQLSNIPRTVPRFRHELIAKRQQL
jgi:hypothetical protein